MLFEDKVDINETKLLQEYPEVLDFLLKDMTTGHNVLWCTDDYVALGDGYKPQDEIRAEAITVVNEGILKSRTMKDRETQIKRIRTKGEVFTPSWLCNKMNNAVDEEWFGQKDVFNVEGEKAWKAQNYRNIIYPDKSAKDTKSWQSYVKAKRLEITCGEAPYLTSRYDMVTGEMIPLKQRIGLLDRKIHVLNGRRGLKPHQWLSHLTVALQSVYGYDWQGDNVILARENLLMDVIMFYQQKFKKAPSHTQIREWAEIIAWNIWQMDGLKYVIPKSCKPVPVNTGLEGFGDGTEGETDPCPGCKRNKFNEHTGVYCRIKNWDNGEVFEFKDLVTRKAEGFMAEQKDFKFDVIIGNPPYQEKAKGDKPSDPSIYHYFVDATYSIGDTVELVTPGRFLFDAGATPKEWNNKMIHDEHLKVLFYDPVSSNVFKDAGFKGGVAIHYRDANKILGPVEVFTQFKELNSIRNKVFAVTSTSLTDIMYNQNKFCLDNLYKDYPELKEVVSSDGREKRMTSSCLGYACFHKEKQDDSDIKIIGVIDNVRYTKYINLRYVEEPHQNLRKYKVIVPANNGSGAIGEVISTPLIGEPLIGYTQTFISVGSFDTQQEADAALKYVKTKFCRVMLGILKVTQNGKREVWKYVPLQDFTSKSDIDWTKSVAEIDQQLYKKYMLTKEEIAFIESHVKEMA